MADEFQIDKTLEAKYAEYKKRKDGQLITKAKEICELNKQLHAFLEEKKKLKDEMDKYLAEIKGDLFREKFQTIDFDNQKLRSERYNERLRLDNIKQRTCTLFSQSTFPTAIQVNSFTFEAVEVDWRRILTRQIEDLNGMLATLPTTIQTLKTQYDAHTSEIAAIEKALFELEEKKQSLILQRNVMMDETRAAAKKSIKLQIEKLKTPEICALLAKRKTLAAEYGLAKDLTFSADGDRAQMNIFLY